MTDMITKRVGALQTTSIIHGPAREPGDAELHVTVWNDKGEIVIDEIVPCRTVTEEEVNAMVGLIDSGVPACISAYVVTHGPKG